MVAYIMLIMSKDLKCNRVYRIKSPDRYWRLFTNQDSEGPDTEGPEKGYHDFRTDQVTFVALEKDTNKTFAGLFRFKVLLSDGVIGDFVFRPDDDANDFEEI